MSTRSRNNGSRSGGTIKIDGMYSLKIDNLTFRTRVEDLRRYFEKFGPIGDIYIPRDQFSRSSRGYAFVRYILQYIIIFILSFIFLSFTKKRDAEDALDRMDGADIDGREIRVQFARYGRASATDSREKARSRR
jgi:arginine/serine-rich splicing factor 2